MSGDAVQCSFASLLCRVRSSRRLGLDRKALIPRVVDHDEQR